VVSKPKKPYIKHCSNCGKEQRYGRKDHYKDALLNDNKCKSCSGHTNNFKGKIGPMPIAWFDMKKRQGLGRNLEWTLDYLDVVSMHNTQQGKCALSGLPINWADKGLKATVSIDRIDSSKGYLRDNIQLVHKDVNMIKQSYDQLYFINLCKAIASRYL
jgi:hypothetical protein